MRALVVAQHGALAQKGLAAASDAALEILSVKLIVVRQHLFPGPERARTLGGFALDEIGVTVSLVVVEFPEGAIVKTAALAEVV